MKYSLLILLLFIQAPVSFAQSIQQEAINKAENVDGILQSDNSRAWGIIAIGNGQNGFDRGDTVKMDSDEDDQISCEGTGRLAGIC